ncbi:unnamed protein product [Cuscuta europaea]|uniref:Uncharacterized protein n=1 Tax=Cuscuta europaea TaxID=41803 RepID=A0A9P0ZQB9_CUSEU|nr:unnamed protein product [Cuscuta europaea]
MENRRIQKDVREYRLDREIRFYAALLLEESSVSPRYNKFIYLFSISFYRLLLHCYDFFIVKKRGLSQDDTNPKVTSPILHLVSGKGEMGMNWMLIFSLTCSIAGMGSSFKESSLASGRSQTVLFGGRNQMDISRSGAIIGRYRGRWRLENGQDGRRFGIRKLLPKLNPFSRKCALVFFLPEAHCGIEEYNVRLSVDFARWLKNSPCIFLLDVWWLVRLVGCWDGRTWSKIGSLFWNGSKQISKQAGRRTCMQ